MDENLRRGFGKCCQQLLLPLNARMFQNYGLTEFVRLIPIDPWKKEEYNSKGESCACSSGCNNLGN